MKPREQIELVKKMESPMGKLQAAMGQFPKAEYVEAENFRKLALGALHCITMAEEHASFPAKDKAAAEQYLQMIGRTCAEQFKAMDPAKFRYWADFIDAKKKPDEADPVRVAIGNFALDRDYVNLDDVYRHLGVKPDESTTRKIYRIARTEFHVRVYSTGKPGRKMGDTKRRKTVR
jgi:hypothetical protein